MPFVSSITTILLIVNFLAAPDTETGSLTVEIPEIKEQKGNIAILLFSSEEGFPNDYEKAVFSKSFDEYSNSISHTFEGVPFGTYAITIAQDRNNNGKIDRGRIVPKPKEPIGMSNMTKMDRPNFSSAAIDFNEDGMSVTIQFLNQ